MNLSKYIFTILLFCFLYSCGQGTGHQHKLINKMEYGKLKNKKVREAIEAWQSGNSALWLSFFTEDVVLLDDGHPRNFKKFSTEAIGHERFISFDKIINNGFDIYGRFHTETWGDFKTYFKFHLNKEGKFDKLEIGQADY